jgi:hypothetical protein
LKLTYKVAVPIVFVVQASDISGYYVHRIVFYLVQKSTVPNLVTIFTLKIADDKILLLVSTEETTLSDVRSGRGPHFVV